MLWRVREGMQGLLAAMRPPGVHADHRGRVRAAGPGRRGGPRPAGAARPSTASCPGWPATPRPATCTSSSRRTSARRPICSATTRFMHDAGRPDRRQVRRLAEGRARHRAATWRPFVEREWGATATELMWRIKALADPARRARPGRRAQPRSRGPSAQPRSDARDRGRGDQVHRVRLLRAGVPVAQRDHHAAPADRRCGARWRASRAGSPVLGRAAASSTSYDGHARPAPPTARARPPARWRSTPAHWSRTLRAAHARAARPASRRASRPSATRPSSGPPGRRCAPAARPPGVARRRARGRAHRTRCAGAAGRELVPAWSAERPRAGPARGCPSRVRDGAAAVYLPVVPEPDLRQRRAGAAGTRRVPEALVAVSQRAGLPLWIPDDVAGALLRDAVELEGLHRRARLMAQRAPRPRCGAGATAAGCRWSSTPARARTALRRRAGRSRGSRCSTRSTGSTTGCSIA